MDERTVRSYETNAAEFAERYESAPGSIGGFLRLAFAPGSRVLDIGAGSGRDMAALLREGHDAWGIEPSDRLRAISIERHPELAGRLRAGTLPEGLPADLPGPFDGLLCSAVFQHIPRRYLFDSVYQLRPLLREHGRLLVSIPAVRSDVGQDARDTYDRLFNGVKPDELRLLFERAGFRAIGVWEVDDGLGRRDVRWVVLLFELWSSGAARPLDVIAEVVAHDQKWATYKLALFRALVEIANTQPHLAVWRPGRDVAIRLDEIVDKWIIYYWPLLTQKGLFVPQTRADWKRGQHRMKFARELRELSAAFSGEKGLTFFVSALHGDELNDDAQKLLGSLRRKLRETIREGPVKFALGGRLFKSDGRDVLLPSAVWSELVLMGHWVQDALLLRWAELTSEMSGGEVSAGTVIELLLTVPNPTHETHVAREIFRCADECVWTGQPLRGKFDADHFLPFAVWKNNDLWNLLPAHPSANSSKRDRLPSVALVRKRQDCILGYWNLARDAKPKRFNSEAMGITGLAEPTGQELLQAVCEVLQVTALQRGCEWWEP